MGYKYQWVFCFLHFSHITVHCNSEKQKDYIDAKTLLNGNAIFTEFKGALTEQYVLQQLVGNRNMAIYYWSAEGAESEIDFVVQLSGNVIPIEVKAEENLQAKSLKTYCGKYNPKVAIRTSMSDFRKESWLTSLPLYAIGQLENIEDNELY